MKKMLLLSAVTEKKNQKDRDKYDLLAYQWVDFARENLMWPEQLIYAIAFTPAVLLDTDGKTTELSYTLSHEFELPSVELPKCNCHSVISAGFPQCNGYMYTCIDKDDCEDQSWGCGLAWLAPCNGICRRKE